MSNNNQPYTPTLLWRGLCWAVLLLGSLNSCRHTDPCPPTPTSAKFRIFREASYYAPTNNLSENNYKTRIIEEDTFMIGGYIDFEALDSTADRYEWRIGTDVRVFTTRRVRLYFDTPDADPGNFQISLTVHKNEPDTRCYPEDDGVDTQTQTLTLLPWDKLPLLGSYYGWDEQNPSKPYTVRVWFKPRGTPFTGEGYRFSGLPGSHDCNPNDNDYDFTTSGFNAAIIGRDANIFANQSCWLSVLYGSNAWLLPDRNTLVVDYAFIKDGNGGIPYRRRFVGVRMP